MMYLHFILAKWRTHVFLALTSLVIFICLFVVQFWIFFRLLKVKSILGDAVSNYALKSEVDVSKEILPLKRILLWDSFADFNFEDGSGMFSRFKCPQTDCSITHNHTLLPASQVVLFHMRESTSLEHLPNRGVSRPAGQKWTFVMKEPPIYSDFDSEIFNGVFDWTMTYRRDSDIPWLYGGFVKRAIPEFVPDYYSLKSTRQNSTTSVSWVVSRCQSQSKREDFAKELQRHIDVAVYGHCGTLKCSREKNAIDSCLHVSKYYHFYLAFENSICPDYVTEKLYKILAIEDHPPIPIVMGGANYSVAAPPGSVIDINDFTSAHALAEFLKTAMSNRTLYNSFHAWRQDYRIFSWGTPAAICQLCAKAHTDSPANTRIQPHSDLGAFWDKKTCHKNLNNR